MRIEDVEYEILLGLFQGERPADLLYMSHSVAASRLANGDDFQSGGYSYFIRELEESPRRHTRLLFGAGLLLCPIFEPVKHQNFQDYTAKMVETRLGYVGIATDPEMKLEFGRGVEQGIRENAFQSLENANERLLWKILRRTQGGFRTA